MRREVLRDGEDALLFDRSRSDALQAALATLVADAALRARLVANARRTLLARGYTWVRNAERVVELISRLRADLVPAEEAVR